MQKYLAAYTTAFGLDEVIRLDTEVTAVQQDPDDRWTLTTASGATAPVTETFDRLVVANGVFCEPTVPPYPGLQEFRRAGGILCAGTEFHDAEQARGKRVLVVGYGKSACDVTVPVSGVAMSTDVIARQMLWKVPRRIGGRINFKLLLLTRLGEALFRYARLRGVEKFLHGPGKPMRDRMINSVGTIAIRQYGLDTLGLAPSGQMEDIVRGAIGLVTEGFYENVATGAITVHRDRTITRVLTVDGRPFAELSDGTTLPADLIVCATGFSQGVPFLPADVQERLFDERGNFMLYRQIQPVDVPGLYFNGYNSSFFSPLNAEMAAVWIAADLAGMLALPDVETRRRAVVDHLAFLDSATDRHHCRGTKIIPFSMHNVDEMLADVGLGVPAPVRAWHWLAPVAPATYRRITPALIRRQAARPAGAAAHAVRS